MKRVAVYVRVSTGSQTTETQERELRAWADKAGWETVSIYRDADVSGSKGREARPAFDALCKDAARRKFDLVAAWSVDRLSRSLHDLAGFLRELHALRIDLYLHQQALDTTTPMGKAMFQMAGVFAELERAVIRERVMAGLARAKAEGKKLGRRRTDRAVERNIQRALARVTAGFARLRATSAWGLVPYSGSRQQCQVEVSDTTLRARFTGALSADYQEASAGYLLSQQFAQSTKHGRRAIRRINRTRNRRPLRGGRTRASL